MSLQKSSCTFEMPVDYCMNERSEIVMIYEVDGGLVGCIDLAYQRKE
jgi:hypothetical protein